MKYGRLTVIEPSIRVGRRYKALCKCDCGAEKIVDETHLRSGHTQSCGCLLKDQLRQRQTKHGRYYEAEHLVWRNMIKRCTDNRFSNWYGSVKVCADWLASYELFLDHVGKKPSPKHTLDRIDPKGNYEPGNVRWALRDVQSRNTKNHVTNTTGIRGVSWSRHKNKWRVAIYVNNKQKHIGYFENINDAAAARKQAEQILWNN
jgi:hypothetical protein